MVTKVQSLQQYMQLNQRETIQRFVGSRGGKAGLPVATNDMGCVARMLCGQIERVNRDTTIILPAFGLPKVFVAAERNDYRELSLTAFENMEISMDRSVQFDVDHALAKSLSLGRFEYILMNPIGCLPNRSFGALEKDSKDRVFNNKTFEIASITEILKICEVAPVKRGNLAEDCLVGIINARESGLISKKETEVMLDTIRNSENSIVSESYTHVKNDFEKAAKTIA